MVLINFPRQIKGKILGFYLYRLKKNKELLYVRCMDLLKVSANNFMQFKYTIKKERDYFFYSQNNNKIARCLNN
jgi:hypothetical protein